VRILVENIDPSTFENKTTLNPAIFDLENDKMKIDVRESLLDIAKDFYEDLKVNAKYSDIWLVGSNANYNWSEYSDVDLHILLPFDEISDDTEFLTEFFNNKKTLWNDAHNIKIDIYKIEIYVQDANNSEAVNSGGIYSVLYDSWIKHPEYMDVKIDVNAVQSAVDQMMQKFKDAFKYKNDPDKFKDALDKLSDYMHDQRQSGLNADGEFSAKNLAFKYLRRKGVGKKIKQLKLQAYDISKSVGHGLTLGSYLDSKKQRVLSGNKNYVDKLDKLTDYEANKKKRKDLSYSDGIFYSIHGVLYSSLRAASKMTGEKKSTIQYRVHSKNPKYTDYKIIYKK
jgi:hypothetical protein